MALTVIKGTHAFGTGDAEVLSRETTKEYSQVIEGKDGLGDITDVIGVGKKTTVRETKFGTGLEELGGDIVNVTITASNEDFTKTTTTAVTYQE
jgi:O-glycosyl hydrolase